MVSKPLLSHDFLFQMANALSSSLLIAIPNITHLVSIKLDWTNYILWLARFLLVLKNNNLIGFVNGTTPCTPQFVIGEYNKPTKKIDPHYLKWQ